MAGCTQKKKGPFGPKIGFVIIFYPGTSFLTHFPYSDSRENDFCTKLVWSWGKIIWFAHRKKPQISILNFSVVLCANPPKIYACIDFLGGVAAGTADPRRGSGGSRCKPPLKNHASIDFWGGLRRESPISEGNRDYELKNWLFCRFFGS